MEKSVRIVWFSLLCIAIVFGIVGTAAASQVTEGQVVAVNDWTLFIRTEGNEPVSFNPYWTIINRSSVPSKPAQTILPALESGEIVRVSWTMDQVEGRRRIDGIQIVSSLTGTTRGTVASVSSSQLVIRPKDEPGTIRLNNKYVQVERKFVLDPIIVAQLAQLKKGDRITVGWAWDNEGRKRITKIAPGW